MAYVKPQVLVYQEFANTMTSQDTALRPWIVGRLADIHERGEAVVVKDYWKIKDKGTTVLLPELQAGSTVDKDSVKVYADDAILRYASVEVPAGTVTDSTKCAYSVSGKPNQIHLDNFTVASTKTDKRHEDLGIRNVAVDDIVRISAYVADIAGATDCQPVDFVSKVIGYIPSTGTSTVGRAARITNANAVDGATNTNSDNTKVSGTYTGTVADDYYTITINESTYSVTSASGTDNYPVNEALPTVNDSTYTFILGKHGLTYTLSALPASGSTITVHTKSAAFTKSNTIDTGKSTDHATLTITGDYSPLKSGKISEVFNAIVTDIHNTASCENVEIRITSDSGVYNNNVQAKQDNRVNGDPSNWYFEIIPGTVYGTFPAANVPNLKIGDSWQFTLRGVYDPAVLNDDEADAGTYTGKEDDTFIITCTTGGTVADSITATSPYVTIRTLSGSEFVANIPVSTDTITSKFGTKFTFGEGDIALGETWVIQVDSGKDGPAEGIIIRDAIPEVLRTVGTNKKYLKVEFCVLRDVEIAQEVYDSDTDAMDTNWNVSDPYIHIDNNIKVLQNDFITEEGNPITLYLLDGSVSVAYREWLIDGAEKFNYVGTLEDIDAMPGPLTPENPLKYAVYKALANSGYHTVVYTTVTGDTLDAWSSAIAVASGSREIYTVVPLSQDLSVLKLVETLVTSDSNEETCAWKNCFFSVAAPTERMLVGKSDNTPHVTSTNGDIVLARITKQEVAENADPNADTLGDVEIITTDEHGIANADLSSVKPGDTLRIKVTEDSYVPYIVYSVSGNTLVIKNPPEENSTYNIEIWHTLTRAEQVTYIADVAQSFANRRIKVVWPDVVGDNGKAIPSTFLCAALAGLVGGSVPNQGLTRVTISGFDDMSRAVPYFTESQIKKLASSGVWIVMEDLDGTIFTMHGLTTSTISLQYSEEMITRIVDFMSLELRTILEQYIGVTNITAQTIDAISDDIMVYMGGASSNTYSSNGPLVTEYEILDISQDALLKDRINVILSVTIPKATNNIVLRLQAE